MATYKEPKFLVRSDDEYYEFNLSSSGMLIESFKKGYFRRNSKRRARIYCKVFFPPDCPESLWMYYLVMELDGKPYEITSIKKEAFDVLTRGIEPNCYPHNEFYEIAVHEKENIT